MERPLQAAVFDLDDTLYPESSFVRGGLAHAAAVVLPGVPGAGDVLAAVLEQDGPFRLFDLGLERLGIPRDPDLVRRLVQAFRSHGAPLRPFPGVRPMLRRLRGAGLRLALLTDGWPDVQRRKIAALGLAPLFDLVLVASDVDGRSLPKPGEGAFREVEARLGLPGAALAMVGDRPDRDFPAPDALGWRTLRVAFPGGYHGRDPDPWADRPRVASVPSLERRLLGWSAGRPGPVLRP